MTLISIVVPAYNEAERILPTLRKIKEYFDGRDEPYEIIVVDDGSKDNTANAVRSLNFENIGVVSYGSNRGKGYAINYGVRQAKGDWILFTDADNSTPIEEFAKLFTQIDKFEVIVGSRYLPESNITLKQSTPRIIASRFGNALVRLILLRGIRDTQCGFKLFSRRAAGEIFPLQTVFGWGFDMEILRIAREHGYDIKEVGITWHNDDQSKIQSSRVFIKTLNELFAIKRNALQGRYRPKQFSELRRVVKFGLVGIVGTMLDFAVLNVAILSFDVNLYVAVTLGFSAGAINNYILNSLWSFDQKLAWKKFGSYVAISVVGLALSNVIVFLFAGQLGWHYNAAKAMAVLLVFAWNYLLNRQITFKAT